MYKYDAKSIDMGTFENDIREGNDYAIRIAVTFAIKRNPGFRYKQDKKCSEATMAFELAVLQRPQLLQPYQLQEGEIVFNREENADIWTEEMFKKKLSIFENKNFCRERFNELRKIGQYLVETGNFPQAQEQLKDYPMVEQENLLLPTKKETPVALKVALGIILAATVALVLILLLK